MDLDPKWIRVSSILSMMPTMVDGKWKYPMQDIDPEVLQRKCDIGTEVHSLIAGDLEGVFMPDRKNGYFASYEKWRSFAKPVPAHVEKRFYFEPMNLTGCVDALIDDYAEDGLLLVDFKTTVQEDSVKWPIQAAFYKFLAEQSGLKVHSVAHFVRLDKNGEAPKVHEYHITRDLTQTAISLYNAYIYLTKSQR